MIPQPLPGNVSELFDAYIAITEEMEEIRKNNPLMPNRPVSTTVAGWNEYVKAYSVFHPQANKQRGLLDRARERRDVVERKLVEVLPVNVCFEYREYQLIRVHAGDTSYPDMIDWRMA